MQRHIIDFIRRPDTLLDDDAILQLQRLVQQHPYFHVARILLLEALYKRHDPSYDETLRRTAILVPCREAVFRLTEEPHYTQPEERKRYDDPADPSASRTVSLIDNFLEAQLQTTPSGQPIDAAQDYIGYLLWQESLQGAKRTEELPMNGGGVVEDFLEKETGRIVLSPDEENNPKEKQANEDITPKNDSESEILTEIMAGIYIKQGKYENAVKIIRQLSLKYPKKNRYFADQIRFLEKLILNNKHK